jgi:hypothetical protein
MCNKYLWCVVLVILIAASVLFTACDALREPTVVKEPAAETTQPGASEPTSAGGEHPHRTE